MKKLAFLLMLLFGFFGVSDGHAQACAVTLTSLDSGRILVGLPYIKYVVGKTANREVFVEYPTLIQKPPTGQPQTKLVVADSYASILARSYGTLVEMTNNGVLHLVNRGWVESVKSGAGGRAEINLRDGRTRFLVDESYTTMRDRFLICPDDAVRIYAENGLYMPSEDTIRLGGPLIEDTRIWTRANDFTVIDTASTAAFGIEHTNLDTVLFWRRTFDKYKSAQLMGNGYWINEMVDTVNNDFLRMAITRVFPNLQPSYQMLAFDAPNNLTSNFLFEKNYALIQNKITSGTNSYTTSFYTGNGSAYLGALEQGPDVGNGPQIGVYGNPALPTSSPDREFVYLRTRNVDNTTAQNGQFLRLKDATVGRVEFETLADTSATNELQTLSFSSPNLSISGGNSVSLSPLLTGYPTGSGTTGTLPIWTGTSALGNSSITESGGEIIIGGTGSLRFPNGTTAQRPTHAAGKVRWNTTTPAPEISNGLAWQNIGRQNTALTEGSILFGNSSGEFNTDVTPYWDNTNKIYYQGGPTGTDQRLLWQLYGGASRAGLYQIQRLTDPYNTGNWAYLHGVGGARKWLIGDWYVNHDGPRTGAFFVESGYYFRIGTSSGYGILMGANVPSRLPGNNNATGQNQGLSHYSFGTNHGDPFVFNYSGPNINQDSIRHAWEFNTTKRMRNTGTFMRWGNTVRNVDYLDLRNNGEFTFGGATPISGYLATFSATSGIVLPRGTTAQRPTATPGGFRYNSTLNVPEWSNGTSWFAVPTTDNNGIYTGDGNLPSNIITNSWFNSVAGTGWYWYNQNDWQGVGHFSTLDPVGFAFDAALESTVRRTSGSTETGAFRASSGYYGTGRDASRAIQHDLIVSKGASPVKRVIALMSNQFDNGQRNSGLVAHIDSATNTTSAQMRISVDDINPLTNGKKIYVAGLARNFPTNLGTDFIIMPNGSTPNYLVQSLTRSGGGWTNYDWIRIADMSDQSTGISLYNGSYTLPNAAPNSASGEETVMKWTGTGSSATPSFHNLKTESYNVISSTSSPQTFSSTVSDNLISQGGTQASFTFKFPPSPADGQILKFTWHTGVTSVTLDGNGNTIIGTAVTSGVAGTQRTYKFYSGVGWIRTN